MTDQNCIFILAAGKSSRLGRRKQLLAYGQSTLLNHAISTALVSQIGRVFVVLGYESEEIQKSIIWDEVSVIVNPDYEKGMSTSLQLAVEKAEELNADGLICMVCDQPFVTPKLLQELIRWHREQDARIVASQYDDTFGVPAFFHRSLFDEFKRIEGDRGAKLVVKKYLEETVFVPFFRGSIDIDTEGDYEELVK